MHRLGVLRTALGCCVVYEMKSGCMLGWNRLRRRGLSIRNFFLVQARLRVEDIDWVLQKVET